MLLTDQVVRGSVGLGFVTLVVHPLAAPSEDRRPATFRRSDVRRILEVPAQSYYSRLSSANNSLTPALSGLDPRAIISTASVSSISGFTPSRVAASSASVLNCRCSSTVVCTYGDLGDEAGWIRTSTDSRILFERLGVPQWSRWGWNMRMSPGR